ncbi:MAG: serine/threonine-protein kinase [Vulcanimicrobiota bacterium]
MNPEVTCQTLDLSMTQDLSLTLNFSSLQNWDTPSIPGYSLESRIGRGSFGEIWQARQLSTGRTVAVKFFPRVPLGAAQELEKLAKIGEHPQVVSLLDAQLSGEHPFLVMPLLHQSLGAFYRSQEVKALQPDQGLRLMTETCRGLQFVHRRGLLHGDLKPDNILLDKEGRARLTDFGQSQLFGEGAQLGTLMYMPPAQIQACLKPDAGEAPSNKWDFYALGATFYFLLSGEYPRLSESDRQKLAAEMDMSRRLRRYAGLLFTRPLRPLQTLNRSVPTRLALIIERCLEVRDDHIYRSAADLLADLQLVGEVPYNWYDELTYRVRTWLSFVDTGWFTAN